MVKVKSCVSLCPIPDSKSFLGLSEDCVPESLIVTLGRNLVLRTKTTDFQQLTSWNIRDQLTAPVVHDAYDNRYIGIFNHSFVKYWSESEQNYEKAKKYKFVSKLHSVVPQQGAECLLVFSHGHVQLLSTAIHSRSQAMSSVIQADEKIVNVHLCGLDLVALIVAGETNQLSHKLYLISTNGDIKPVEIDLKNGDLTLVSHCVHTSEVESTLITLWSDGNIYSCRLGLVSQPLFPGSAIMHIKTIKTSQPVAMQAINPSLLVLYGCDPGEEGALLLVADTRLRAIVCRHYFKMYSKPPRLWVIRTNIVLSMGQYLALVPFQMTSQLLDSRIKTQVPDDSTTRTVHWEEDGEGEDAVAYETYEDKFRRLLTQNSQDLSNILTTLDSCAEIPSSCLIQLIKLVLKNTSDNPDLLLKILNFPPPKSAQFKMAFDFDAGLKFLERVLDTGYALCSAQTSLWVTCVLDAHYHRFLLSEETKTQELLQELRSIVQLEVSALLEFAEVKPRLERKLEQLEKRKKQDVLTYSSSHYYSYEILKLY